MRNNLALWGPFKELPDTRDIFDRFFNWDLRPARHALGLLGNINAPPAVDVYEENDRLFVKSEIPGLDKKDIKVTVDDGVLTIKGERKKEEGIKEKDYYCCGRVYGSFSQSIPLPVEVEKDNAKASYKNGILTIDLPKSKDVKTGEIEVAIR